MKALCITIGPDWELAKAEFERVGLAVEPFRAIVEDNRVLSFNKSVYECMKIAKGDDLMLFEDDVKFDVDSIDVIYLQKYLIPDYLSIHLGCNIIGTNETEWQMPSRVQPSAAKLHNCWQSHATIYSRECVDFIIENFKYVTDEYKTEGCQIFDEWLRTDVLTLERSYVLNPMIAYQRPRFSAIWNCETDYTGCHKQGNDWLKRNL